MRCPRRLRSGLQYMKCNVNQPFISLCRLLLNPVYVLTRHAKKPSDLITGLFSFFAKFVDSAGISPVLCFSGLGLAKKGCSDAI